MIFVLAGGLAVWLLLVFFVLCICRAASRADENEAGRRFARVSRSKSTATLAAAVVVLPAAMSGEAHAACANRDLEFDAGPALMQEAVVCEIERIRARNHGGRLRLNSSLALAASRHAADMFERRYFFHVSPGGGELADRVRRAGYAEPGCSWRAGEILAWGVGSRSTAASTIRAWLDSSSHRQILLSRRYSQVGVGIQPGTPFAQYTGGITAAAVLGSRDCSN
jgi:uncharacterized protein YkwD